MGNTPKNAGKYVAEVSVSGGNTYKKQDNIPVGTFKKESDEADEVFEFTIYEILPKAVTVKAKDKLDVIYGTKIVDLGTYLVASNSENSLELNYGSELAGTEKLSDLNITLDVIKDNRDTIGEGDLLNVVNEDYRYIITAKNASIKDSSIIVNGNSNYIITFEEGALKVNPREITVKAKDKSDDTYGVKGKDLSGYLGLNTSYEEVIGSEGTKIIGSDDLGISLKILNVVTEDGIVKENDVEDEEFLQVASKYIITGTNITKMPDGKQIANGNNNYKITFIPGTLSIKPREIKVTVQNQTKTYGVTAGEVNTQLNNTANNVLKEYIEENEASVLVTGDSLNDFGIKLKVDSASIASDKPLPVKDGGYVITAENGNGTPIIVTGEGVNSNYKITFVPGTLLINPKDITVTVKDDVKTYTYGETAGNINKILNAADSDVLVEIDGVSGESALVTGDSLKGLGVKLKVILNTGDNVQDTDILQTQNGYKITAENGSGSPVIVTGEGVNKNYNIIFVEKDLVINKRDITIKAKDKEAIYGSLIAELKLNDETAFEEVYDKVNGKPALVSGDNLKDLLTLVVLNADGNITNEINTLDVTEKGYVIYALNANVADDGSITVTNNNYNITFVPGTLNIKPKLLKDEDLIIRETKTEIPDGEPHYKVEYDGKEHGIAEVGYKIGENREIIVDFTKENSGVKIEYFTESGEVVEGTPINAGKYYAKVTLSVETGNYTTVASDTLREITGTSSVYEITPKDIKVKVNDKKAVFGTTIEELELDKLLEEVKEVDVDSALVEEETLTDLDIELVVYKTDAVVAENTDVLDVKNGGYVISAKNKKGVENADGSITVNGNGNYNITFVPGKLTIEPKLLTNNDIVIVEPEDGVYDGYAHEIVKIGYKDIEGKAVYVTSDIEGISIVTEYLKDGTKIEGKPIDKGEYTAQINLHIAKGNNYNYTTEESDTNKVITKTSNEFEITPKEITVKAKDVLNQVYGLKLSDLNLDTDAAYTEDSKTGLVDTELRHDTLTGLNINLKVLDEDKNTVTVTNALDVGEYKVTAENAKTITDEETGESKLVITGGNPNYTITFEEGTLTIVPKILENEDIVIVEPKDNLIYDGTEKGIVQVGYKVGEEIINLPLNSNEISIKYYKKDNTALGEGVLPVDADKYYAKVILEIKTGNYTTVKGTRETIENTSNEFEITPKEITVKAKDVLNQVYGLKLSDLNLDTDAAYTEDSKTGLVDTELRHDNLAGLKINLKIVDKAGEAITVTNAIDVGEYKVTAENVKQVTNEETGESKLVITGGNPNYTITFEEGTLTIIQKEITVSVKDTEAVYGTETSKIPLSIEAADGTLEDDDKIDDLGIVLKVIAPDNTSDILGVNDNGYIITGELGTDDNPLIITGDNVNKNYKITLNPGTLTIKPKAITIKAADVEAFYGTKVSELNLGANNEAFVEIKADGKSMLVGDDTLKGLGVGLVILKDEGIANADDILDVKEEGYVISANGISANKIVSGNKNYIINFVEDGILTIKPKVLQEDDIVIKVEDAEYTGKAHGIVSVGYKTIAVDGEGNSIIQDITNKGDGIDYTVSYFKKDTTSPEVSPINAGTYYAKVVVSVNSGNYTTKSSAGNTISKVSDEYKIGAIKITGENIKGKLANFTGTSNDFMTASPLKNVPYDGNDKTINISIKVDDKEINYGPKNSPDEKTLDAIYTVNYLYRDTNQALDKNVNGGIPVDSGIYIAEFVITGQGNYTTAKLDEETGKLVETENLTLSFPFKVTKKRITSDELEKILSLNYEADINTESKSYMYDGEGHGVLVSGDKELGITLIPSYSKFKGDLKVTDPMTAPYKEADWEEVTNVPVDSGYYIATITFSNSKNYQYSDKENTSFSRELRFKIDKRPITVSITDNLSSRYGEEITNPVYTISNKNVIGDYGLVDGHTLIVPVNTTANKNSSVTEDGYDLTLDVANLKVSYMKEEQEVIVTGNYEVTLDEVSSSKYMITPKRFTEENVNFNMTEQTSFEYNGDPQGLNVTYKAAGEITSNNELDENSNINADKTYYQVTKNSSNGYTKMPGSASKTAPSDVGFYVLEVVLTSKSSNYVPGVKAADNSISEVEQIYVNSRVFEIKQAEPKVPTLDVVWVTVGDTIADIELPVGFTFEVSDSTKFDTAGVNTAFTVKYDKLDAEGNKDKNYKTMTNIPVTILVVPSGITATYGDTLGKVKQSNEVLDGFTFVDGENQKVGNATINDTNKVRLFNATYSKDGITVGSYEKPIKVGITVNKADLTHGDIIVKDNNYTYNGGTNAAIVEANSNLKDEIDNSTISIYKYYDITGTEYEKDTYTGDYSECLTDEAILEASKDILQTGPVNSGNYLVTVTVGENDNYNEVKTELIAGVMNIKKVIISNLDEAYKYIKQVELKPSNYQSDSEGNITSVKLELLDRYVSSNADFENGYRVTYTTSDVLDTSVDKVVATYNVAFEINTRNFVTNTVINLGQLSLYDDEAPVFDWTGIDNLSITEDELGNTMYTLTVFGGSGEFNPNSYIGIVKDNFWGEEDMTDKNPNIDVEIVRNTVNYEVPSEDYEVVYRAVDKSGNVREQTLNVIVTKVPPKVRYIFNDGSYNPGLNEGEKPAYPRADWEKLTQISLSSDVYRNIGIMAQGGTLYVSKFDGRNYVLKETVRSGNDTLLDETGKYQLYVQDEDGLTSDIEYVTINVDKPSSYVTDASFNTGAGLVIGSGYIVVEDYNKLSNVTVSIQDEETSKCTIFDGTSINTSLEVVGNAQFDFDAPHGTVYRAGNGIMFTTVSREELGVTHNYIVIKFSSVGTPTTYNVDMVMQGNGELKQEGLLVI